MREYIKRVISNKIKDIPQIQEESFQTEYSVIKKALTYLDGKKIKLKPVSFGYHGKKEIKAPVIEIKGNFPHIALQNLSDKIVYIENIENLSFLHYLKISNPAAVITNTEIRKPIFIENFPVFYIPSFIKQEELYIKLSTKKIKKEYRNIFLDIGVGTYFIYINLPVDSRFQDINSLSFYGSLSTLIYLLEKLISIKYPKGYRTRIIISDMLFSDYEGLYNHINKIDKDKILSIINIENCGIGNEKLIIKNRRNLLDSFHYIRIKKILEKAGKTYNEEKLEDYSNIDRINLPVIWFASQPNESLYNLKKEFLNEKLILNFVNDLFFIINKLYKDS
ncbi:hypothetical protein SAMN06265182_1995 [Persephonella hydrogeniphila]|uniref:Uncharacterized protein n=1 Tax=Persephonella hydrogeniphila TaxID=198703 RepID=A0A285NPB3_9AQUI|nr:hypothetical protein [Persephonella hydrogeniphila]SNZ11058.1 hypothetical protein SAMN06265182_1995 [Persephonella hydrogeniphila]